MGDDDTSKFAPTYFSVASGTDYASIRANRFHEQNAEEFNAGGSLIYNTGDGGISMTLLSVMPINTGHYLLCALPDDITHPMQVPPIVNRPLSMEAYETIKQDIQSLGTLSPDRIISEEAARKMHEKYCNPSMS